MQTFCRHWQTLSEELGIQVQPKPTLTFAKCLEMGLDQHVETIAKVAEVAGKEFSIEQVSLYSIQVLLNLYNMYIVHCNTIVMALTSFTQALDKMESEWDPVLMEICAYKETGTFIMKSNEETGQMLDDHIVMTQAMSFSPYKKPFEVRITTWENKLRTTQVHKDM